MWSEERLRDAVRTRLRAVLDSDCPTLEPGLRTVLEQRLDSAGLDLMDLIRKGMETGSEEKVKLEPVQVKEDPPMSDLNIICVKVEPMEQDLNPGPNQDRDFRPGETLMYCPQCGAALGAPDLQRPPLVAPPPVQPRCQSCGQSSNREVLLLEHNYTQDQRSTGGQLERARGQLERAGGQLERAGGQLERAGGQLERAGGQPERAAAHFHCSVCGQQFCRVGALLEHMSEHLSMGAFRGLRLDSEAWVYEDDAFDGSPQGTMCSICETVFGDCDELREHLRDHLR